MKPDRSPSEYLKEMKAHPDEEFRLLCLSSFEGFKHMLEFLPQKLSAALKSLSLEGYEVGEVQKLRLKRSKDTRSSALLASFLAKKERQAIKSRLPEWRGGNKKTKPAWRGSQVKSQYAIGVNERRLLAVCMKQMYDDCEGEAGWLEDLKASLNFQRLSVGVPKNVITWAYRRIASDGLTRREKEPLSVALEMSRQELGLPEVGLETLHGYYSEGTTLLKQSRKSIKT
jgi:hypothetical protein